MVIYDEKNGRLYIPQNGDQVFIIDKEDVYNQGFAQGYEDGFEEGLEECGNNDIR